MVIKVKSLPLQLSSFKLRKLQLSKIGVELKRSKINLSLISIEISVRFYSFLFYIFCVENFDKTEGNCCICKSWFVIGEKELNTGASLETLFCVEWMRCSEITVSQFDTAEKSRPQIIHIVSTQSSALLHDPLKLSSCGRSNSASRPSNCHQSCHRDIRRQIVGLSRHF